MAPRADTEAYGHLPSQVTKLYTDAKCSCDVFTDGGRARIVPELSSIHRKFRIQKDRLITWGFEWSDHNTATQGSIDEAVARAGLTEVVTSVLSNIKDIIDEAERIRCAGVVPKIGGKSWAEVPVTCQWEPADKSRCEDLVKDLTTSIDILYDLSRARRTPHVADRPVFEKDSSTALSPASQVEHPPLMQDTKHNDSELTLVNPPSLPGSFQETFPQLPAKIELSSLLLPEEEPPPYSSIGTPVVTRMIGLLRAEHAIQDRNGPHEKKVSTKPVLIEYAMFDITYTRTGIHPPLQRFKSVLIGLSQLRRNSGLDSGTLIPIGYFEDPKEPRYGLVFELPAFYSGISELGWQVEDLKPVSLFTMLQMASKSSSIPNATITMPPLEVRYRLALNIVTTLRQLHVDGMSHRDVSSGNVIFFKRDTRAPAKRLGYDLRTPTLCSFDMFSEYNIEYSERSPKNIYRHPNDSPNQHQDENRGRMFDIYGLGLVLLEVGLWIPLADVFKPKYTLKEFKTRLETIWIKRLAAKCGSVYMRIVQKCIGAADNLICYSEPNASTEVLYSRVLPGLQRCCSLDENDDTPESLEGRNTATSPVVHSEAMAKVAQPNVSKVPQLETQFQTPSVEDNELQRPSTNSMPQPYRLSSLPNLTPPIPHAFAGISSPSKEVTQSEKCRDGALRGAKAPKTRKEAALQSSSVSESTLHRQQRSGSIDSELQELRLENSAIGDGLASAAAIIQQAWHSRREHMSWKEYCRKVTLVQKLYRERRADRQRVAGHGYTRNCNTEERANRAPIDSTAETYDTRAEAFLSLPPQLLRPKPKLRLHPVKLPPHILADWEAHTGPRLARLLERTLHDSEETMSIDLLSIGETALTAKPTIVITCTSTAKVKRVMEKRFSFDKANFDVKVKKGKVRRSRVSRKKRQPTPRRCMGGSVQGGTKPLNPHHQPRPICGASIGAFRDDEHLPPVSFGGVVLVDGEPYGMSVHHLLDAPSDDESENEEADDVIGAATRSSANTSANPFLLGIGDQPALLDVPDATGYLEISDEEAESYSEYDSADDDCSSLDDSEDEDAERFRWTRKRPDDAGDIPGHSPFSSVVIPITQPAIDDVDDDFFPNLEDRDADHLDSHGFGYVHASSGIRRWVETKDDGSNGGYGNEVVHEIDWALFKLSEERLQPYNVVEGGKKYSPDGGWGCCPKLVEPVSRATHPPTSDLYPIATMPQSTLASTHIHSIGRTSGLRAGTVTATPSFIKIRHRTSFSRSWGVTGGFGVGGDSGAWIVGNERGEVAGHVLAFSQGSGVAYFAPMEVLLADMERTLGVERVCLPGSEDAGVEVAGRARATADADAETGRASARPAGPDVRHGRKDSGVTRGDGEEQAPLATVAGTLTLHDSEGAAAGPSSRSYGKKAKLRAMPPRPVEFGRLVGGQRQRQLA